jgi:hypothetical protein
MSEDAEMSTWITPRQALTMLGQKKLAQLTNEIGQAEIIGVGNGTLKDFTTPFVFGSDLKIYDNGTIAGGYTFSIDYTNEERVKISFATAPALNHQITASSTDSVNADNLEAAMARAQGLVRGMLDAQLYVVPLDNATNVNEMIVGWASAIAWYFLATDPRRARLIEAYPELEKRYIDVYAGVDSDLKRVAKGNFSLRGILQPIDPSLISSPASEYISNVPVFTAVNFRGVM